MGNRWDERYRNGEHADKDPERLLVRNAGSLAPGRALDIACGLGRNALWLAQHGWRVTAVDYSEVALAIVRERAAQFDVRVETVCADLEAGGFAIAPESYELVCDCCFLHRPLFDPMRDGVRPGGFFLGVYPLTGDAAAPRPTNPAYLIRSGELQALFADWEIVHAFEGRPGNDPSRRLRAEIVARKPVLNARV